jgi:hypothetical protein
MSQREIIQKSNQKDKPFEGKSEAMKIVKERARLKEFIIDSIAARDASQLLIGLKNLRHYLFNLDQAKPENRERYDSLHLEHWEKQIEKLFKEIDAGHDIQEEFYLDGVNRIFIGAKNGEPILAIDVVSSPTVQDRWKLIEQSYDIAKEKTPDKTE